MIPRYRARNNLFISHLITVGQEFDSELTPGLNWEPINDEARAAVEKHRGEAGKVIDIVKRVDPGPVTVAGVEIPDDWRTLSGPKRRGLAKKLGASANVKEAEANDFIAAALDQRDQKAA
jgi:hypothetical protein